MLERYRRSLVLLACGAVVSGAAVGTVWWPVALLAAMSLLVAIPPAYARIGCGTSALVLLAGTGHPLEQALRPPSYVTVLLVVVVAVVCATPRPRRELDAAMVGAAGVVVIDASAAIGFVPALTLVPCTALVVAALWYRQRAMADREPPAAQTFPPRRLIPVALLVVALGMLAAPAPASTGLHVSLFHRTSNGPGTAGTDGDRAGTGSGTLDLDIRGPLGREPVIAVTAAAPDLWRGAVFSTYDGRTWQSPPGVPEGSSILTGVDSPFPRDPLDPVPPGATTTVSVRPVSGLADGQVYAPGVVTAITTEGRVNLTRRGQAVSTDLAYDESVVLPVTDPSRLAAAAGADPGGWTQLPAELPQRVRDLASGITAAAPTRPAKVAAVESYLRQHERYTLEAPVPSREQDAIDAFLFGSHEGFCEQFASAEVVLLRSVGIPARLATGYAYGTVEGPWRVFDQGDAHAWVEVSYPGLGWSPSDPTAGAQILPGHQSLAQRLRSIVATLGSTPYRRASTAGCLTLLFAALVGASAGLRRLRRRRHPALGPVSAAFARLERQRRRDPAATPREWVTSWSEPGLADALATWEAELFSPDLPDAVDVDRALATVARVRRAERRDH